jgi:hypothetical protein
MGGLGIHNGSCGESRDHPRNSDFTRKSVHVHFNELSAESKCGDIFAPESPEHGRFAFHQVGHGRGV